MKKKLASIVIGLAIASLSGVASAQFGGLTSALGGGASSGSSVTAESLVKSYVGGTKNVMTADSSLLKAVGLKDEAAKSELSAKNLTEGATASALEDSAKVQTASSEALTEKFKDKSVTLDASAKKEYVLGLVNLAKGIKDYTGMTGDVKNFKPSVTSVGSAAGAAVYIAKSLPDTTKNLMNTLQRAVEFAREKKIELPAEVTSLL